MHIATNLLQELWGLNRVLIERKSPFLKPQIFALLVLERLIDDLGERQDYLCCSLLKQK